MRKWLVIFAIMFFGAIAVQFTSESFISAKKIRKLYSRPPAEWPSPSVDKSVSWKELGVLPLVPVQGDSLRELVELRKTLFFEPRLSGSLTISCASCHVPELSWSDGRARSPG